MAKQPRAYEDRFTDVWEYYKGNRDEISNKRLNELRQVIEKMVRKRRSNYHDQDIDLITQEAFIRLISLAAAGDRIKKDFLGMAYICVLRSVDDFDAEVTKIAEFETTSSKAQMFGGEMHESAEQDAATQEAIADLRQAMDKLHIRDQEILWRHYGCKEKLVDIAPDLGIPEDQMSSYRNRALTRLTKNMRKEMPDILLRTSTLIAKPKSSGVQDE